MSHAMRLASVEGLTLEERRQIRMTGRSVAEEATAMEHWLQSADGRRWLRDRLERARGSISAAERHLDDVQHLRDSGMRRHRDAGGNVTSEDRSPRFEVAGSSGASWEARRVALRATVKSWENRPVEHDADLADRRETRLALVAAEMNAERADLFIRVSLPAEIREARVSRDDAKAEAIRMAAECKKYGC